MLVTELVLSSSPLATAIPIAVASFNFRKFDLPLRTVSLLLFIAGLVQLIAWIFWTNRINNLFLLHIYTVIEFAFITMIYRSALGDLFKSWIAYFLIIGFIIVAILDAAFVSGISRYNVFSRSTEALIIIVFTLLYFIELLRTMRVKELENDPFFWLSAAFLLYFSGSFFLFVLSNSILYVSVSTNKIIWSLHAILAWIMYLTITVGLWKARRN